MTSTDLPRQLFCQNVRNECLGKVPEYGLAVLRHLAMTQENPEGGALKAPARKRVKAISLECPQISPKINGLSSSEQKQNIAFFTIF